MSKKKYSDGFVRDVKWYFKVRHRFTFDGNLEREVEYDKNGVDGIKAFHVFDSTGRLKPTKHPNILKTLLKTKGSINLHIKMYAEDRARGYLPKIVFTQIVSELEAPEWSQEAVEKQKIKYY